MLQGPIYRQPQLDNHVSGPVSGPPSSGSLYYLPVAYLVLNLNPTEADVGSEYFCISAVPRLWPILVIAIAANLPRCRYGKYCAEF